MNRFRLARYSVVLPDEESFAATDLAVPIIDDVPLFVVVGSDFPGVPVVLVAPPSGHWLTDPDDSYVDEESGRPAVLDGSCGIAECCGVMARIDVTASTITWSDFVVRGRGHVPSALQLTFDRAEYERALAQVLDIEPTAWTDGAQ